MRKNKEIAKSENPTVSRENRWGKKKKYNEYFEISSRLIDTIERETVDSWTG